MAKVAFTKLGLTKNTEIKTLEWKDVEIEIKQYLPIQERVELIQTVLNKCQDENNFVNEIKLSMYFDLETIYRYTNINFTDKQKEDVGKLYDLLRGSGLMAEVKQAVAQNEENWIWLKAISKSFYEYRNSVYAIIESMKTDYTNLDLDADAIKEKIADPEALGTLKEILTKMG